MVGDKIYVSFKAPPTIGEFIKLFFSVNHGNTSLNKNVETFFDEKCTLQQCKEYKMRSFDDMMVIINTYYPGTTPKQLMHELLVTDVKADDGGELYFHMGDCPDIERIRCYYSWTWATKSPWELSKYNSKWSWSELLAMLGIKNLEDMYEYVKQNKVVEPWVPSAAQLEAIEACERRLKELENEQKKYNGLRKSMIYATGGTTLALTGTSLTSANIAELLSSMEVLGSTPGIQYTPYVWPLSIND
jgi:hypothetical protein